MKDFISSFVLFVLLASFCGGLSIAAYSGSKQSSKDHYVASQKRVHKQKNKAITTSAPEASSVELIEELEEEQNDEELDLDYGRRLQNFQDSKEPYEDENSSKFYIER